MWPKRNRTSVSGQKHGRFPLKSSGKALDSTVLSQLSRPGYRADLDGLRAIAILAVVGFHAFPDLIPGGFVGVDIFFVISGFLISTIIIANLERGTFRFGEFYARRVKRIFPGLALVMIACTALGWITLLAGEFRALGKHTFAGAAFMSNFAFWIEGNYFDRAVETKPLLHLWSLGVEEQFYIVFPLLLWFAWKRGISLLRVVVVLAIVSFTTNIFLVNSTGLLADIGGRDINFSNAFYSPLTRGWELLLGACLAHATLREFSLPRYLISGFKGDISKNGGNNALAAIGAILILFSTLLLPGEKSFPGWYAGVPALGAFLMIAAGASAWINRRVLAHPLLVWIGLISYPLYLWHWPLLAFLHISENGIPSAELRLLVVVVSVVLAWLTYKLIESPIRFGGGSDGIKIIALSALMMAIGLLGLSIYIKDGFRNRAEEFKQQSNLMESFNMPVDNLAMRRCKSVPTIPGCHSLADDKAPTVALIGDSHALHLFVGLSKYYQSRNENLLLLHLCMPLIGVGYREEGGNCSDEQKPWIEYLAKSDSIRTVILSFRGPLATTGTGFRLDERSLHSIEPEYRQLHMENDRAGKTNAEIFSIGLRNTLLRLSNLGKQVIFIYDNPELGFDPRTCVEVSIRPFRVSSYSVKSPCGVDRRLFDGRSAGYRELVKSVLKEFPTVKTFSPSEELCDVKYCYGYRDGMLLYYDDDHLAWEGSMLIGHAFAPN